MSHQEILEFLHDFMIGDISGTKGLKLIWYISEPIKGMLNMFIIQPLESVEEASKSINLRVSLSGDTLIKFDSLIHIFFAVSRPLMRLN